MVIHMTRREGRRVVEEAVFVEGYEAKGKPMGHSKALDMGFIVGMANMGD